MSKEGQFGVADYFRYLEGELSQRDAFDLECHIAESKDAQMRLRSAQRLVELLSTLEPELAPHSSLAAASAMIDSANAKTASRREPAAWLLATRWQIGVAASVLVVAVAVSAINLVPRQHTANDLSASAQWRVKSTGAASLAGVEIHRQTRAGTELVSGDIRPDDRLLFAYRNFGNSDFRHLMIFAIAPPGDVYWYYPAYADPATDPLSMPVTTSDSLVELSDAIGHDFKPGPLAIYALFSRTPAHVSQVEALATHAWRAEQPRALELPPPLSDALQQVHVVIVR